MQKGQKQADLLRCRLSRGKDTLEVAKRSQAGFSNILDAAHEDVSEESRACTVRPRWLEEQAAELKGMMAVKRTAAAKDSVCGIGFA